MEKIIVFPFNPPVVPSRSGGTGFDKGDKPRAFPSLGAGIAHLAPFWQEGVPLFFQKGEQGGFLFRFHSFMKYFMHTTSLYVYFLPGNSRFIHKPLNPNLDKPEPFG